MAAQKIEVVTLHCDQGMGTLIKIFDSTADGAKPAHLVLIDLGSESTNKLLADWGVKDVFETLKANSKLDLLIVSHQDKDHWSQLPILLKMIKADSVLKTSFSIGAIHYGGLLWKDKASDAIEACAEYVPGKTATAFATPSSDYNGTTRNIGTFAEIDGVKFHLLCANIKSKTTDDSLIRNASSAVIAVEFGKVFTILPGDATAETIGWINDNIFAKWGRTIPVTPCRVLGIPHHGALRTIADNYVSDGDPTNLTIGTKFARYVQPENIVASAGYLSRFSHPYKSVMVMFSGYVEDDPDDTDHSYVWYDVVRYWVQMPETVLGIWTTVETLGGPSADPTVENWLFKINKSGQVTFQLRSERAVSKPQGRRRERYPAVSHKHKR